MRRRTRTRYFRVPSSMESLRSLAFRRISFAYSYGVTVNGHLPLASVSRIFSSFRFREKSQSSYRRWFSISRTCPDAVASPRLIQNEVANRGSPVISYRSVVAGTTSSAAPTSATSVALTPKPGMLSPLSVVDAVPSVVIAVSSVTVVSVRFSVAVFVFSVRFWSLPEFIIC